MRSGLADSRVSALAAFALLTLAACAAFAPSARAANAPPAAAAPAGPPMLQDCPTCPTLVVVPAGAFALGTAADVRESDAATGESPPFAVTIGSPFAIARTEVTVAQYRAFVQATGHEIPASCRVWGDGWFEAAGRTWAEPGFATPPTDADPVVCVSHDDARAYAAWLAQTTRRAYRLPSEAEWEYAARAATTGARWWSSLDSSEDALESSACEHANVYDLTAARARLGDGPNARCRDGYAETAPVAQFGTNAFGLADALGNVREWLQDCYTVGYAGRPPDGRAWEWSGCELRGVRGGSWATRPRLVRSAARGYEPAGRRQSDLGFRVLRDLTADEAARGSPATASR